MWLGGVGGIGLPASTQNHCSAMSDRIGKCLMRLLIFMDPMTRASVIVGTLMFAVSSVQVAMGCSCLAIAQMKPDSSRAIAAVITVGCFPARASLRYRRHSRS